MTGGFAFKAKSCAASSQFLARLPEFEQREILRLGKVVTLAADDSIYNYGDAVKHLYFPFDAVFSTTSLMEDGSSAEISLTGCEGVAGVFAAFNEQSSRYWTSTLIGGDALKVEIAALQNLLRDNDLLHGDLLEAYRNLINQISQRAVCNGRHSLAERFCFWLLLVHDRTRRDEILLTHETIAKKLGARRAGVTNIAGSLQAEKVIAYSRGAITILDRPKLEKMSCECYQSTQIALNQNKIQPPSNSNAI